MEGEDNSQSGNELTVQWDDVLKTSVTSAAEKTSQTDSKVKAGTKEGAGDNTDKTDWKESFNKQQSTFTQKLRDKDTVLSERDNKIIDLEAQIATLVEENKGIYTDENGKVDVEKVRQALTAHKSGSSRLALDRQNLESEQKKLMGERRQLEKEKVAFAAHKKFGVPLEKLMECKHPLEMISLISKEGASTPLPKPPGSAGGQDQTSEEQQLKDMYPTMFKT